MSTSSTSIPNDDGVASFSQFPAVSRKKESVSAIDAFGQPSPVQDQDVLDRRLVVGGGEHGADPLQRKVDPTQ